MTTDVLLLCPLQGNGGIHSWSKKYLSNFPDNQFHLYPVDIAPNKPSTQFRGVDSWIYGTRAFIRAFMTIRKVLRKNPQIQIMHTTTSGGSGVLRDYYLGKYCKKRGLIIIMHCRFGAIEKLYLDKGWKGNYYHRNLALYDQIWVLDRHSENVLKSDIRLKEKVFLVPNPISVPISCNLQPKRYKRIGFVGNLIPSKGLFELIEAILNLNDDTELVIAGEGKKENIEKILNIINVNKKKNIKFLGKLPNQEAIKLIESLDILALPTYFWGEAFPISILEAMGRGKLIISCSRAAIPDMLTSIDGTPCGILVKEKSPQAIANAIKWCQEHPDEADQMCKKAYNKVYTTYRDDIVYNIYLSNYNHAICK